MTLYNLAESLILEVAGRDTIMGCMNDKRIAEVYYDDNEDLVGKVKDGYKFIVMVNLKRVMMWLEFIKLAVIPKRYNLVGNCLEWIE